MRKAKATLDTIADRAINRRAINGRAINGRTINGRTINGKIRFGKTLAFMLALALIPLWMASPAGARSHKPKVRIASVSWTGVTVKSELGVKILEALGYDATNIMLSVPIVYQALGTGEADIFLGNWMPSMASIAEPLFKKGTVVKYVASMPGAKYTLAVPRYVKEAGLTHFKDIAKYADRLNGRIYGIEEGNDGNIIIDKMIDNNMFGLGDFELIPSSEAGMLAQVEAFMRDGEWIVFLGWSPHYMNQVLDMAYLDGSTDETFGPDDGTATVYTNIRAGFDKEQPNVAVFLQKYIFPIAMMNEIMTMLHKNPDLQPIDAGLAWIKSHPDIYKGWLDGVKTVDGKPALPAFQAYLDAL